MSNKLAKSDFSLSALDCEKVCSAHAMRWSPGAPAGLRNLVEKVRI